MNIKALPSMGQRLFCCFCFVESAVCSTFAERIIRGCFRGWPFFKWPNPPTTQPPNSTHTATTAPTQLTCLKCTNRARSTPLNCTNRARSAPTELRWCT